MDELYSTRSPILLERVTQPTEVVRALIEALDQELSENYLPEQRHGLELDAIFQPHVRFLVAWLDKTAVGCGGIALNKDFAEIKRMFVRSGARGTGIADAIMTRLTNEALEVGLNVLRLETGTRQIVAIRFYERCGFKRCGAFEPYALMPADAIKESVFLE